MKSIFKSTFYLRSNYVNKEGKNPVMLRIYLNNERLSIGSTGISVLKSLWDIDKERLKGRTTEVLRTNLQLDNISTGCLISSDVWSFLMICVWNESKKSF